MGRDNHPSAARQVATTVLFRVTSQDAYASPTLDGELRRRGVTGSDANLATEIVYGSLRNLDELDAAIEPCLSRSSARLEPFTRAALRVAAYQVLKLDRVAAYAAVHDAVAIVRSKRGERLSGFVNAVLRCLTKSARSDEQPRHSSEERQALSVPRWLHALLLETLSDLRVNELLRPGRPPTGLRAVPRASTRALGELISAERPSARLKPGAVCPSALLLRNAGNLRTSSAFITGRCTIQEEGAQLAGWALDAQPGERVLDACAGSGGKTLQLLEGVGETGSVTAVDIHASKLERLDQERKRLRSLGGDLQTELIDLAVGTGGLEPTFDRVLVDAPCTGVGTLRRRPEILLRLGPEDPSRMSELQRSILTNAARLVRPGGLLAYVVCSPLVQEGARVAEAFEKAFPSFERVAPEPTACPIPADNDHAVRIGPWLHSEGPPSDGPDAFQLFFWRFQGRH